MKNENEILSIRVSNKQTAIFLASLVGYPVYFGLPANAEDSGHDHEYVMTLESRITDLETTLIAMKKDVGVMTALIAKDNLELIENESSNP